MIWVIIIVVFVLIFIACISSSSEYGSSTGNINEYYSKGYIVWLETRKGFDKFSMVGMYYRNLKRRDIGKFEGYAKADKLNPYDLYAVAIYDDNNKHLGFLPAGNKKMYDLILENGGTLPAYGVISCGPSMENIEGQVAILTNIVENPNTPFYNKTVVLLGRFDMSKTDLSEKLKSLGAHVVKNLSSKTEIAIIGDNVSELAANKLNELTASNGRKIKTLNKEDLFLHINS